MLEKIIEYLKKKGWTFTYSKNPNALIFSINGFNAIFHCLVDFGEDESLFLFITYNGTICPAEKRLELGELFTRINNRLRYGNFEAGMESGEIKFRTSIFLDEIDLTEKVIDNVILKNIYAHDVAFIDISKFIFGSMGMEDAFNSISPPILKRNMKSQLTRLYSLSFLHIRPSVLASSIIRNSVFLFSFI